MATTNHLRKDDGQVQHRPPHGAVLVNGLPEADDFHTVLPQPYQHLGQRLAQPVKPATFTRSIGWRRPSGDSAGAGSRISRCQCPRRPTRSRPAPGQDLQVVCVGTSGPRHTGVAV